MMVQVLIVGYSYGSLIGAAAAVCSSVGAGFVVGQKLGVPSSPEAITVLLLAFKIFQV